MTVRAPGPTTETDHGPLFIIDALKGTNGTSMFITAILHPHHATPTLNISLSKEACGGPACVSLERVFQPYVGYERIGDAIRRANEDGEIVGEMDAQVLYAAFDQLVAHGYDADDAAESIFEYIRYAQYGPCETTPVARKSSCVAKEAPHRVWHGSDVSSKGCATNLEPGEICEPRADIRRGSMTRTFAGAGDL